MHFLEVMPAMFFCILLVCLHDLVVLAIALDNGGLAYRQPLPSTVDVMWQILIMTIVNDAAFYWVHRLLHSRFFYSSIHKKHHQFRATIGIAAEYAHPIEGVFAGVLPSVLGAAFLQVNLAMTGCPILNSLRLHHGSISAFHLCF